MAGSITNKDAPKPEAYKPPPPILRQELNLLPAEKDTDGSSLWILHDPLTHRHFRIGELEMNLLLFCGQGDEEKVAKLASIKMKKKVTPEQVGELFEFLRLNNLIVGDDVQKNWFAQQKLQTAQKGWLGQLAKSYLFIRIPFWKADRFLTRTLKYVAWLGKPSVFIFLALLMFVGFFLALRKSDSFVNTFLYFFNGEGFVAYVLALAVIKLLHELGHAYTAKNMGCKVPIIGVAFLVGFPILYTDTSDAWKLNSRRKRMSIGAAGVGVEIGVAIICLFCWNLVDDGMLKSVFFLLATTTWIMSILVNFNPMMRFDGYYLLSDWLRMPNLEARAFAMAKWLMREKIFGLNLKPPEPIQKKLIIYSYSIWIYRFFLFLGIAILVYYFFFKVLGIILFVVELVYFILRPMFNELKEWKKFWSQVKWNKSTFRSGIVGITLIVLAFIPWRSSIEISAIIKARYTPVYAPVSGKITAISVINKDKIKKGDILLKMDAPELTHEKQQVTQRHKDLIWQREFLGFDKKMRNEALIVSSELATQSRRLRSLSKKYEKLKLVAQSSGVVADKMKDIVVGDWIGEGTQVLAILETGELEVIGYLQEEYLSRVEAGFKGVFHPEGGNFPMKNVEVIEIEGMSLRTMNEMYSASLFGGNVAVRETEEHSLIPVTSIYKIRLKLLDPLESFQRVRRGTVILQGIPESFVTRVKNKAFNILRRETEF